MNLNFKANIGGDENMLIAQMHIEPEAKPRQYYRRWRLLECPPLTSTMLIFNLPVYELAVHIHIRESYCSTM